MKTERPPFLPIALLLGLLVLVTAGCSNLLPHTTTPGANTSNSHLGGTATTTIPAVTTDLGVQLVAHTVTGTHVLDYIKQLKTSQYSLGLSGHFATHGALFTFTPPSTPSFWMKDTPTRLLIYFLDPKGNLLGQDVMAPNSTTTYTPPLPIKYAIELPAQLAPDYGVQSMTLGGVCPVTNL